MYSCRSSVQRGHQRYLLGLLRFIFIVDAKFVCPYRQGVTLIAQVPQRYSKVPLDLPIVYPRRAFGTLEDFAYFSPVPYFQVLLGGLIRLTTDVRQRRE